MYLEKEKVNTLFSLIEEFDQIIIHRHMRPDPDALGSQLGLKNLIQNRFPNKTVLAAGTTSKGLAWLGSMDKVKKADYEDALVIVCDTANQPRIEGDYYKSGKKLVKIDHHPVVDEYGDLQMVYPQSSSTSEIVALISQELADQFSMTVEAAALLYAGIVGDSGRFLFSSTTPLTMQVAGDLMNRGIDFFEINDRFRVMSLAEAKFQGYIYEIMEVSEVGVAHVIIKQADLQKYGISEEQTNSLAGLLGSIDGILTWCLFVEQESGNPTYRCRLRSKGPIINGVAANHEGGGHPLASGANAYTQEDINQIVNELTVVTVAYSKQLKN